MSFRFLRLTLRDWLVYEGEVNIHFGSPQDGRNLFVVYGMNGYGKTSLLRATQWLFHDKMPDRHIKNCFNQNALRAGRYELRVSAEFTYNGRHYHLIRRAIAKVSNSNVAGYPKEAVDLSIDHQVQKADIADKIDQILPNECQQFFFFDGLEIEKYATETHTDETRQAIETVLGIPEVRNLSADLEKLSQELEHERDQLLRNQSVYDDLRTQKEEAKLELEAAEETLENLREKYDNLQQQIDFLEERANELERAQDEIRYLKDLRRRNEELKERLDGYEKELQDHLKTVTKRLVLPLLKERVVVLTTQASKAQRTTLQLTQTKAQAELIKNLLEGDDCVCGRELDGSSRDFLEKQLAELEDRVNSSQQIQEKTGSYSVNLTDLKELENRIEQIEKLAGAETIQRALLTKYKLQIDREEVEQEINMREEKLKDNEDTDVGQVFTTLSDKRQDLGDLRAQIRNAGAEVKEAKKVLNKCQKALNEASRSLQDESRVVDVLQLTLAATSVAKEMVEGMLQLRRVTIEQQMTNVFRMVTNKKQEYDRIELDEAFAPCIVTQSGHVMKSDELSAGEKEILAFSFIAGLNQSTETNAPLVMDTPFGHLDVHHRNGLLEALPKLPCQVVLLATDRDLPEEELPNLSYCLGRRFDIIRDQIAEKSFIQTYQ